MAKRGGFPGPGGMSGMGGGNMMKQIQKMQNDMIKAKEELETRTYTAEEGNGAVKVSVNGKFEITELVINPTGAIGEMLKANGVDLESFDAEDFEIIGDLVMTAANQALAEADSTSEKEMSKYTAGMNLPF